MEGRLKKLSKEELKELYDKDFPLWAEINLELLKEKAYELVDWEHLLEEIEDMARSELKACISYLAVILEHLYKWDNFRHLVGELGGRSWVKSVENARDRLRALLENYPSLEARLPKEMDKAWNYAVAELRVWLRENRYNPDEFELPKVCPYTYQEALTRDLRKEFKDEGRA